MGISAVAYLIIHKRVYGGWTVYATGDHFVDGEFEVVGRNPNLAARTRRLSGLLLDKEFRLIPWTPAFFALIPAFCTHGQRSVQRNSSSSFKCLCWMVCRYMGCPNHAWLVVARAGNWSLFSQPQSLLWQCFQKNLNYGDGLSTSEVHQV